MKETDDVKTKGALRHKNICRHVTPEPEILLQEKFDSNDNFFPYSYKERVCAPSNSSVPDKNDELQGLQKCFESQKLGI